MKFNNLQRTQGIPLQRAQRITSSSEDWEHKRYSEMVPWSHKDPACSAYEPSLLGIVLHGDHFNHCMLDQRCFEQKDRAILLKDQQEPLAQHVLEQLSPIKRFDSLGIHKLKTHQTFRHLRYNWKGPPAETTGVFPSGFAQHFAHYVAPPYREKQQALKG